MAGVTATIDFSLAATLTGAAAGSSAPSARASVRKSVQLEAGNAALGKADLLYTATRTLAASATENLDLAGVLVSPIGATVTAAEVVAIVVEAAAGNTNPVVIGGAASNAFLGPFGDASDVVKVKPGQLQSFVDASGWAVTAGTGDILKMTNGGAGSAVTYTITVIARSVAD